MDVLPPPHEILEKKCQGQSLSESENAAFLRHLQTGRELLVNIPRLEEIAEAIAYQEKQFDVGGPPSVTVKGKDIPLIAKILKVALDYDNQLTVGKSQKQAINELYRHAYRYDPEILAALKVEVLSAEEGLL